MYNYCVKYYYDRATGALILMRVFAVLSLLALSAVCQKGRAGIILRSTLSCHKVFVGKDLLNP